MFKSIFSKKLHTQIITQLLLSVGIFLLASYTPKTSYAICGTYMSGVCTDATTYNEISPYEICPAGPTGTSACCSTYSECPGIEPSPYPSPSPNDISKYSCGTYLASGECMGLDYKTIPGGQQCSDFPNECCIDFNECRTANTVIGTNEYFCDTSTGTCIDKCSSGYESNCDYNASGVCTTPHLTPLTCISSSKKSASISGLLQGKCGEGFIDTALGCTPVSIDEFTPVLLKFLIGIAGGAALILMIVGAVMVMTGGSNPEQVQRGKEIFTGAITGLLFIIFSVVVLQIIAGDIIKLPGFTK